MENIHPRIFQKKIHKNERGHVKKSKNENFENFCHKCWYFFLKKKPEISKD